MYTYIADFQDFADDSNKDMTDQEQSSGSESDIGSEVDEDEDPAGINIAAPSSSSSTVNADEGLVGDSGVTCLFNQTSDHTINDLSQNPECAPCQPQLKQFPKQKIAKVYRSFRSSFYATYQWLEYSVEKDSVYCFYCRHFAKLDRDSRTKTDDRTFVASGFRNWKKCYGSDPKRNKLLKHQLSSAHSGAVAAHGAFQTVKRNNDSRQSVLGMISDAHMQTVRENRHYLKTLCEILCLTAERQIAQRESSQFRQKDVDLESLDFGPNSGIFLAILGLVAKHDKIVATKIRSGPNNAKYTHHTVQNALLGIMAEMVVQEISSEICSAQYFSVLADESKDMSKKEQVSVIVRYLFRGSIHEEFVGLTETQSLNAQGLTDTIVNNIRRLSSLSNSSNSILMQNCIGQGYDGASVVAGHLSGVNVLIRDRYAPCAQYIHCFNHRLNLVLVDVVKSVSCCAETLSLLQSFYVFLSGSSIHQRWVSMQRQDNLKVIELKSLSETRWACQSVMITAFCSRLEQFLAVLQVIIDSDCDAARVVAARGFLGQVDRTFVRYLFALKHVLMSAKSLSDFLQNPENSLSDALAVVESFVSVLQNMRSDEKCDEFWTEANCVCESLNIPERVARRKRRLCSRLAGSVVDAPVEGSDSDPESFQTFKRNIFAVIDKMLSEIDRRFSDKSKKTMKGIDALTPKSENFLDENMIREFADEYSSLINVDYLSAEIANLHQLLQRKKEADSEDFPVSLLQLQSYIHRLHDAFAECDKLITIACTLPISTASCERSFSTLRIVKSYLRTSMGNDRLQDLLILGIHRARASKLNLNDVVSHFAQKFPKSKIQLD